VTLVFSLYALQEGGAPLWSEQQNLTLDAQGRYTVLLGAGSPEGLPLDLFTSGAARWLGVTPSLPGAVELPRVLLVGMPYALKAADADTLGGLPASAFVQVGAGVSASASGAAKQIAKPAQSPSPNSPNATIVGAGAADYLPLWTGQYVIGKSMLYQTGGKLGIRTTTPVSTLDVNGTTSFEGLVTFAPGQTFPGTGTVTSVGSGAGLTGGPITSSGMLSIANGGVTNAMLANNSVTVTAGSGLSGGGAVALGKSTTLTIPSAGVTNAMLANNSLTVTAGAGLSGGGAVALGKSTTLTIPNAGVTDAMQHDAYSGTGSCASGSFVTKLTRDAAPTCAAGNTGTITQVTAGTDLTGGGSSGNVTLNLDTTKVPTLAGANVFTAHQTVNAPGTALAATSSSSSGYGVSGTGSGSSSTGVSGTGTAYGVSGTGGTYGGAFYGSGSGGGVYALSADAQDGVYAQSNRYAVEGNSTGNTGSAVGVYGHSGASGGAGVQGEDDADGNSTIGVYGVDGGTDGSGVYGRADGSGGEGVYGHAFGSNGTGVLGDCHSTYCQWGVFADGDLGYTGVVLAPVAMKDDRVVSLYGMASTENWFEDFGSGQLKNGVATIQLDPTFTETVTPEVGYHVFLTPKGDCEGLYVTNETPSGFEVHELRKGTSSVAFDYRIVAKRKGVENLRLEPVSADPETAEAMRRQMADRGSRTRSVVVPKPRATPQTPPGAAAAKVGF